MHHETAAERARAFVEENEDLVEGPETSEHVLAAIINQGADIAVELGHEYEAAANEAVAAANKLREAQEAANRDQMSPRMLGEAERPHRLHKARYDEAEAELNRFMAFVGKVQEHYQAKTQEEKPRGPDDVWADDKGTVRRGSELIDLGKCYVDPKENERYFKPSFWRRWFGSKED